MSDGPVYLTGQQVRERYGNRPSIWLYRRQKDADFPKPIYIAGQQYFLLADLLAYESDPARKTAPETPDNDINAMKAGKAAAPAGEPGEVA